MPGRALLLPLFAALAVAVAGCGTASTTSAGKFSGESKNVAQTVDDLSTAARKSDEKAICTQLFARSLVQQLNSGSSTCQKSVSTQIDSADDTTLKVESVKVTGTNATAVVTSKFDGHDQKRTLKLVRENGGWRIAGYAG
jgi:hypothetical protein